MATARQASLILLFALAFVPDRAALAGMVLLSGSHWAVVRDTDGMESDGFNDITPGVPFEGTASADYRMLGAYAVFNTFFDTNLLTSRFESIHSLQQTTQESPDELFSESGTTFWLSTDMDIEVSVQGSMTFDLGVADSETAVVLEILDGNQDTVYRSVLGSFIGTGAGMFLVDDSIVLDGGGMYFVHVHSDLLAFAHRNPGPLSTASSEIAVVIATVPEPTSLALLCCGALLARKRSRRTVGAGAPSLRSKRGELMGLGHDSRSAGCVRVTTPP